jgi:hypothetical protein
MARRIGGRPSSLHQSQPIGLSIWVRLIQEDINGHARLVLTFLSALILVRADPRSIENRLVERLSRDSYAKSPPLSADEDGPPVGRIAGPRPALLHRLATWGRETMGDEI